MAPITQGGTVNWNITKLYVEESGIAPAEVLSRTNPFDVKVDFGGSGPAWTVFESTATPCTITFHFERIGSGSGLTREYDSPPVTKVLGPAGTANYTAMYTVPASTLDAGVYRVACLIEIVAGSGVVGFEEGLVISIT